ncbi:MAG: ABC transporter substrate-binding protein [Thermodesulfobacteriota bacterium]
MRKTAAVFLLAAGLALAAMPALAPAAETIKIAAIYALTGKAAVGNIHALTGVKVAVEEINGHGGLLGRKIELLVLDNRSTPEGSAAAAKRAEAAGAVAIVGPAWSSHTFAAGKVAQAAGLPLVSSTATHPDVTKIGDFIFRTCFVDSFQGKVLARFIREDLRGDSVVVLVDPKDEYSTGLAKEFVDQFTKIRGVIMARLEYSPDKKSFADLIAQVAQYDPQFLFIPGHLESASIIVEAQRIGLRAIPVGGDGWDAKKFFEGEGAKIKRGYYCTHWSDSVPNFVSAGFLDRYHDDPVLNAHMALGYDTVFLVAEAIKRAGEPDRKKIRDALAETKNFLGVTGTITFDKNGDPIKGAVIMKIKNGRPFFEKAVGPG